jgi:hypothetical protein
VAGAAGVASQGVRAGRAFVELFSRNEGLYKGLDQAKRRLSQWAVGLAKTGAGVGGVGAAVAAPLAAVFKLAADRGDQVQKLADRFGATTQAVGELSYAFERGGMGIEEFGGWLDGLASKISAAADANEELIPGLRKLNGRALINKGLPEQLDLIADGLESIREKEDQVDRANRLGLGGMLPYLKDGAAGLAKLRAEAEQVGAVLSPEEAKQGHAVMREWDRLWQQGTYTLMALGRALLPDADGIHKLADMVSGYLKRAREWIADNKRLVITVGLVAVGLVGLGTAFGAASLAASALAGAVGLVSTVLGAVFSPLGLTVAALGTLGYLFATQTGLGREWAASVGTYFETTKRNALETVDAIGSAVSRGDLQAAWQIATKFLELEWVRLEKVLSEVWHGFLDFFSSGWDSAVFLVKSLWNDMTEFLATSMLRTMGWVWRQVGRGASDALGKIAAVAEAIGLKNEAAMVRRGLTVLNTPGVFEGAEKLVRQDAQAERSRLSKELQAQEDARKAAADERKTGYDAKIKELQEQLDALTAREKEMARGKGDGLAPAAPGGPALPSLDALQKGVFSGPVAMQLGYADQTAQRQLDKMTEVAANTKGMAEAMKGFAPPKFGP